MDTDELIKALAADKRKPAASISRVWWIALGLAITFAAAIFFATLDPRPDIAFAAETPRFLFKLVFAITLAASAFILVRKLAWPGEDGRTMIPLLAIAPALLVAAVIIELLFLPPETWAGRMFGANSLSCLAAIFLIGLGPLAIAITALRHGAPTRPTLAGAAAGLLAGGIAASLYAIHCPDDSPLFVAVWYTIAITGLATVGSMTAQRFARW